MSEKLDDANWPRECYVCTKYPRPGSLYCSDRCQAIVEGQAKLDGKRVA